MACLQHPVEQLGEALAGELGQDAADRLADEILPAKEVAAGGIDGGDVQLFEEPKGRVQ